jgi:hypothetical protein
MLRRVWPETGWQVAVVVVGYTAIVFGLSYLWSLCDHLVVPYGRLDLFPFADEIFAGSR